MKSSLKLIKTLMVACMVQISTIQTMAQSQNAEYEAGPITYDNVGNMYYADQYVEEDNLTGWINTFILISKRSPSNVFLGSVKYNYSTLGESGDVARDIKVIGSSLYVLVAGKFDAGLPVNYDAVLVKFNLSLVLQWERNYNDASNTDETPAMITAGPSGTILLLTGSASNVVTLKYNSAGTLLNQVSYTLNTTSTEWPCKMVYFNNVIYVSGSVTHAAGEQTLLLKYNNSLVQQWASRTRTSPSGMHDKPQDLKVDTSGNPYVSGAYNSAAGTKPYVIKYDPITGARTWTRKMYNINVGANFLFIDNNANPFFYSTANLYVKLDKSNGSTLLTTSVPNGADSYNILDARKGSDNNIYVMGQWDSTYYDSVNVAYYTDNGMYIIKVNQNGKRLWHFYRGSNDPHNSSWPGNIAVRGNAMVYYNYNSSSVASPPFNTDVRTGMISTSSGLRVQNDEAIVSAFTIYPNPTSEFVNLKLFSAESDEGSIEMYDMQGKLLIHQSWEIFEDTNNSRLDVSAIFAGVYIIKVKAGTRTYTEKVVIK